MLLRIFLAPAGHPGQRLQQPCLTYAEGLDRNERPDPPSFERYQRLRWDGHHSGELAGERDGLKLARMKHPQVKASTEQIVNALEGDYRTEHLFALQTAVALHDA